MNSQLHIKVAKRNECSYLKKAFFTTPFKVMNITEDKMGRQLHLMLMSSSPGILDGDEYDMKIEVEQHSSLQLHTQAYQRLFKMKHGATQQMNVNLQDGASFCYLPHPSVPHEQSIFISRNNFYLADNCQFLFGEILTCGRKLNGELFLFSKYHSITNIYINNKLVIKENLLMQPSVINVHTTGQLEGYTHQASMIYLETGVDIKNIQQQLIDLLSIEKNMDAGVSAAPVNGLIVRLLGNGAEQLYDCLQRIRKLLQTKDSVVAFIPLAG
jgi:urease accessory protein